MYRDCSLLLNVLISYHYMRTITYCVHACEKRLENAKDVPMRTTPLASTATLQCGCVLPRHAYYNLHETQFPV